MERLEVQDLSRLHRVQKEGRLQMSIRQIHVPVRQIHELIAPAKTKLLLFSASVSHMRSRDTNNDLRELSEGLTYANKVFN